MPEPIEELYVEIGADIAPLLKDTEEGVDKAEKKLNRFSRAGKKAFTSVGTAAKKMAKGIGAAAVAIAGLAITVNKLTDAYIKQARAEAQLGSTLRATNNAVGLQSDELKKLASDLQDVTNVSDEVILTAESMLLTFKNIGGDIFPRVTESVLDVATAMNSGATPEVSQLRTTAIQLGKALNDPVEGLAALARVGIQFTESQKEQIKTLVEAGRITEGQTIILKELESQFGGSARAARIADQGFEAAGNSIGDAQEKIGRSLIPLREGYVELLNILSTETTESASIVTNAIAGIAATAVTVGIVIQSFVATVTAEFAILSAGAEAAMNFENPIEAMKQAAAESTNELAALGNALLNIPDIASDAFNGIKEGWEEQRDAAEAAAAEGGLGILPPIEEVAAQSDEITNLIRDIGLEMIDLQDQTNADLEANQQEHAETMADIEENAAKERLDINKKYDEELTKSQQEILDDARDDLAKLEEETDKDLERRRKDTNKEELRETEDHLTDMRRLRLGFLDNLEDAVKDRDAGRVRDLQRQFQRESQERQQDFEKNRSREQADTQDELAEIRNREEERAREIIERRTQALADVEQRVAESRARDLTALDEKLAAERERENTRFTERQAELENALNMRLETLAKELSDMEELESESAQRILETLNEYFGAGGNIDQLMSDFEARRKKTLTLEIGFEESSGPSKSSRREGAGSRGRGRGGSIPSFATGGTLLATSPTLAQFGEVPELVQFTPLSKMGSMGGGNQSMQIDLKLSGSAPPGIRSGDRDAIAMVMVNALREAGINTKPGR